MATEDTNQNNNGWDTLNQIVDSVIHSTGGDVKSTKIDNSNQSTNVDLKLNTQPCIPSTPKVSSVYIVFGVGALVLIGAGILVKKFVIEKR